MKIKKTMCLFLAGVTVLVATVNFSVSGKDTNCSKLMKENVEAKSGIIDTCKDLYRYFFMALEGIVDYCSSHAILRKQLKTCGTISIANGVVLNGSDAAKRLLAEFQTSGSSGSGAAGASAGATVSYNTSVKKTSASSYTFSCDMVFGGLWEYGYCVPCDASTVGAMRGCKAYDSCSQLATLRIEAFNKLIGVK